MSKNRQNDNYVLTYKNKLTIQFDIWFDSLSLYIAGYNAIQYQFKPMD